MSNANTPVAYARSPWVWRLRDKLGLRVYGIYTRRLGIAHGEDPPEPGYTHRIFEAGDEQVLVQAASDARLDLDEAFIRERLARGDACDAVFYRSQLIAYTWFAFTPTEDADGVHATFGPAHRYSYKAFTLPEYRGRRALTRFRAESDAYCERRGRSSSIAFIAIDNHSSIRSAERVGNRRIGFAGYLKLGRLFVPFRTPGVRQEGFRFFTAP